MALNKFFFEYRTKFFTLSLTIILLIIGNCEEDPKMRGYRQQQNREYLNTVARGSAVGSMIGSVIPGIGSFIGGIIGG